MKIAAGAGSPKAGSINTEQIFRAICVAKIFARGGNVEEVRH